MAKYVVAVTRIKWGQGPEEVVEAGQTLDLAQFSKSQLKSLHDAGAVELRDDTTPSDMATQSTAPASESTNEETQNTEE